MGGRTHRSEGWGEGAGHPPQRVGVSGPDTPLRGVGWGAGHPSEGLGEGAGHTAQRGGVRGPDTPLRGVV